MGDYFFCHVIKRIKNEEKGNNLLHKTSYNKELIKNRKTRCKKVVPNIGKRYD